MSQTIVKVRVCKQCFDAPNVECMCQYSKVEKIELEFKECPCCGHVDLGNPVDSQFNSNKLKEYEKD